jgi:putative intracellular protease/amidase
MKTVAGVFGSREAALGAWESLCSIGIPEADISLLSPGASDAEVAEAVATTEGEQPGIGPAIGAVAGGASGAMIGTALGTLVIPGVGAVAAVGTLATAIAAAAGALLGAATGKKLQDELEIGLPKDEIFVYEDALRKGRTVVVAVVPDDKADRARAMLDMAGAESVDAAREQWWVGTRDAEEEGYRASGRDFTRDEPAFRRGFEASLNPEARGKTWEQVRVVIVARTPADAESDAFRRGFERGSEYYRNLTAR